MRRIRRRGDPNTTSFMDIDGGVQLIGPQRTQQKDVVISVGDFAASTNMISTNPAE